MEVFFWNGLLLPVIFVTGHDLRPLGLGNGMGNEKKKSSARTDTLKFEERRLGVPFSPLLSTHLRGFFAHGRISIHTVVETKVVTSNILCSYSSITLAYLSGLPWNDV